MIKSGESLEWCVEQLKANQKIPNTFLDESSSQAYAKNSAGPNVKRNSSLTPVTKSPNTAGLKPNRFEHSGSAFGSGTPTGRNSFQLRKNTSSNLRQYNVGKWGAFINHYDSFMQQKPYELQLIALHFAKFVLFIL